MKPSSVRRALVLPVALGLAGLALASPASAAPPLWPADGHIPTCDDVALVPYPPTYYAYLYGDTTQPTVDSVRWTGGRTAVVVGPDGRRAAFVVQAHDSCSGVASVELFAVFQPAGGSLSSTTETLGAAPSDGDYNDVTLKVGGMLDPGDAGYYRFPGATVVDRWSEFALDADYQLIDGSTTDTPGGSEVFRSMDGEKLFVLRQTKVTGTTSKKLVKRGKKVTLSAQAKIAAPGVWTAVSGIKVALQRKTATGWRSVTTLTTNGSGEVAAKQRISKDSTFRFLVRTRTADFYGGSTSDPIAVRTVRARGR